MQTKILFILFFFFCFTIEGFPPRHLSIKEFQELSPSEKETFEKEFRFYFATDNEEKREVFADWWIDAFLKLQNEIFPQYPRDYILGLGQSTAWLLEAREIIEEEASRYFHIAFSGCFFSFSGNGKEIPICSHCGQEKPDQFAPGLCLQKMEPSPSKAQIAGFREYLTSLGLEPKTILKSCEENGNRLVVMDYVLSGRGLLSFIDCYSNWAEEQGVLPLLKQKLTLHVLIHPKDKEKYTTVSNYLEYLAQNFSPYLNDPSSQLRFTKIKDPYFVLQNLFGASSFNRLMRKNPFEMWDQRQLNPTNHFLEENARNIFLIRFQIAKNLAQITQLPEMRDS